jgi:hypothetical protein
MHDRFYLQTMSESWSYSSSSFISSPTPILILHLQSASQVARFNHTPKQSHDATAIKTIVRYLHRTSDKGTIVCPTGTLQLDCYVNADFAGLYGCNLQEIQRVCD